VNRLIRLHLWPRSLFGRLSLILFVGLIAAHVLSVGLIMYERTQAARATMIFNLAKDVESAVSILEQVPAADRPLWLGRLERKNYRYVLGAEKNGAPVQSRLAQQATGAVSNALGAHYSVAATAPTDGGSNKQMDLHLRLADGTPLTVEVLASAMSLSQWVPAILLIQLAILAVFTWLAVRLATRPLAQFAHAADTLGADLRAEPLSEGGPLEVARAAAAFNAMQRRIAAYMAERLQILAAVSHDLQTPITRMRLRVDLMDNAPHREKMRKDLEAMQMLVEEGIAYARNAHGLVEAPCRVDLDALLGSLVYDYQDAGHAIRLSGRFAGALTTRPHGLRRIVTNLVDNALKFGKDVEIVVKTEPSAHVSITVLDRGPGIPPEELDKALQPFYRVESSRNRETGGTGLGLAIAQQLAAGLGGSLALSNRPDGGLAAHVLLPAAI
jgi:signal transduction histidine kinase